MATVTIDDDVFADAKRVAAERQQTVDEVISALTRHGLSKRSRVFQTKDGVPQIPPTPNSKPVTSEMVKRLQDEMGV